MGWPQIAVIALMATSFGISAAKHGDARTPHNMWSAIISIAIWITLLHYGGFFAA